MFTSLAITNFKAFADTQAIPLRPITLVFGANSSGKSSIIHSLLYARHVWGHGDCDAHVLAEGGEGVDLGGFWNLVHAHETDRPVGITVEFRVPQDADEGLRMLAACRTFPQQFCPAFEQEGEV